MYGKIIEIIFSYKSNTLHQNISQLQLFEVLFVKDKTICTKLKEIIIIHVKMIYLNNPQFAYLSCNNC